MFDLTKMDLATLAGLVWILVVKDHFTKYTWAEAFKSKDSRAIARYLFSIFKSEGVPERWHSDNGGEFLGEYFVAAMAMLVSYGCSFDLLPPCLLVVSLLPIHLRFRPFNHANCVLI